MKINSKRADDEGARDQRHHPLHDVVGVPVATCSAEADREAGPPSVESSSSELGAEDVVVRGWYDVAGLRADADLMVWWHAPTSDDAAGRLPRASAAPRSGARLEPVWSQLALHRPAEFNKGHVPAFMAGEEARGVPVRLPVRPLLRVVPAAGRGAPPACSPSTA